MSSREHLLGLVKEGKVEELRSAVTSENKEDITGLGEV